jgi:hypothetical protein
MPSKATIERAKQDKREGKSPSTQAGEFIHEEIEHIRQGKHGARNTKQAIAIGLSEARRAGVDLPPPKEGRTSERTRRSAELAYETGQGKRKPRSPSRRRARATEQALKREGRGAVSHEALSRHAKQSAAARRRRGGVGQGVGKPASARKRSSSTQGSRRKRASSGASSTSRKTRSTRKASASRGARTSRAGRTTSKRTQRASSSRKRASTGTQRRRRAAAAS